MKKLKIRNIFAHPSISTRSSIELIRESLVQLEDLKPTIELDFTDMNFISRSFAHELLELVNNLQSITSVNLSNTSEDIDSMLATVRNSIGNSLPKDRESLLPDFSNNLHTTEFFK